MSAHGIAKLGTMLFAGIMMILIKVTSNQDILKTYRIMIKTSVPEVGISGTDK